MTSELTPPLPRILVVDDSRIVRATVKKHLSTSFDIIEEADGEAGWARLMADPDIMVLMSDLSMPRLDGFGLLARVRKSADLRIKHMPVIIISGEEDGETKNLAVDRGANDFVTKSTDRAEMVARVSAAVKLARTERDLRHSEEMQAKTVTLDTQTGVGTSHLLRLEGEKALARGVRYHGDTTVVLFEIDEFDTLSGELGENVADQLIGLVAKMVAGRLRKEETLSRLGGPRFGVVLYADLDGALIYAARLRDTIAAAKVNFRGRQLRVTASVGIANAQADGAASFEQLLAVAAERLAQATVAGGNQFQAPAAGSMSVDQALALLAKGERDLVMPHLAGLLKQIQPLLDLSH
ncbi:diguanylate cyclase [Chitinimonas sp.]|uniref:GGDEF domain-containing response regulator n=1 Tax=Chitinimonas sp. TaxID=1934313 RepID=UPI0035B3D2BF